MLKKPDFILSISFFKGGLYLIREDYACDQIIIIAASLQPTSDSRIISHRRKVLEKIEVTTTRSNDGDYVGGIFLL